MKLIEALETIQNECNSHKTCVECKLRLENHYGNYVAFSCFFGKNSLPEDWNIGAVMEEGEVID